MVPASTVSEPFFATLRRGQPKDSPDAISKPTPDQPLQVGKDLILSPTISHGDSTPAPCVTWIFQGIKLKHGADLLSQLASGKMLSIFQ